MAGARQCSEALLPGPGRQEALVQAFFPTVPLTSGCHSTAKWRRSQSPQQGSFELSSHFVIEEQVQSGPADAWAGQCLGGGAGKT